MPITFVPATGQVLMCDFDSAGFQRPEMIKQRHCVVVSPRYRRHTGCYLIVPFSTVRPYFVEKYHYMICANKYPCFDRDTEVWAKTDMVTHVGPGRLDRVLEHGARCKRILDLTDIKGIKTALLHALGFPDLANKFSFGA